MTGRHRTGTVLRTAAALVMAALGLVVLRVPAGAPAGQHQPALASDVVTGCPSQATSCAAPVQGPCATCTVVAGPVSELSVSLPVSVYLNLSGFTPGDLVILGMCSEPSGTAPVPVEPDPRCAALERSNFCQSCLPQQTSTPSPMQWEYTEVPASGDLQMVIGTDYDPPSSGTPIYGRTLDEGPSEGPDPSDIMWCDDGPDYCGVELIDVPAGQIATDVPNTGYGEGDPPGPPANGPGVVPTTANTVILPLSFASSSAGGCTDAPNFDDPLQVDTAWSGAEFVPAAVAATCTGPNGVLAYATDEPSVDDPTCTTGAGSSCPIEDVLDGTAQVTLTDDPDDPTTLAEIKAAKGKVAAIPVAVSATVIAFAGVAESAAGGITQKYSTSINSYAMTPAMAAGVMTQQWDSVSAQSNGASPQDDLCGQLPAPAKCVETVTRVDTPELLERPAGSKKKRPKVVEVPGFLYPSTDTYAYAPPGNADLYPFTPAGTFNPLQLVPAFMTSFALRNLWPESFAGEPLTESTLGAIFPSVASGASYQVTQWMCASPNAYAPVTEPWPGGHTVAKVHDVMSAAQLLADSEQGVLAGQVSQNTHKWQANSSLTPIAASPKSCQAESSLPTNLAALWNGNGAMTYLPSSNPGFQALEIRKALSDADGGLAFGAMDSSQADANALFPADLENAAGDFVAPTQASVDAALADAKTNGRGMVTLDYDDTSDAAAYPLPMVTYALVSTKKQPAAQAQQIQQLLTNLVDYSHADGVGYSVPMPAGYYPLPDDLYNDALKDITKDVVGPSGHQSGSSGSGSSASSGSSSSASGTRHPSSSSSTSSTSSTSSAHKTKKSPPTTSAPAPTPAVALRAGHGTLPTVSAPSAGSTGSIPPVGPLKPLETRLFVALDSDRYLMPLLAVVAALCLIVGPLLYLSPSLRRRVAAASGGARRSRRGPAGPGGKGG